MRVDIDGLNLEELIALNHRLVERIKQVQAIQARLDMMDFELGAPVSFATDEGRIDRTHDMRTPGSHAACRLS